MVMTQYNEGHTEGESSGMVVYGCKLHLEWWGVLIHTDWIVSLQMLPVIRLHPSQHLVVNLLHLIFAALDCLISLISVRLYQSESSQLINQLHSVFNYIASSQSNHTLRQAMKSFGVSHVYSDKNNYAVTYRSHPLYVVPSPAVHSEAEFLT